MKKRFLALICCNFIKGNIQIWYKLRFSKDTKATFIEIFELLGHVIVAYLSLSLTHKKNTTIMETLKHITIHLGVLYFVTSLSHIISPVIIEAVAQHGVLSNSDDFIVI